MADRRIAFLYGLSAAVYPVKAICGRISCSWLREMLGRFRRHDTGGSSDGSVPGSANMAELLIILACAALIARLSPVTVPNRPLSDEEKTIYRKKARMMAAVQVILALTAGAAGAGWILECVMYSFLSLSCLMLIEITRRKK